MLGEKLRTFKTHTAISLDGLVPPNNFYRQVEAKLDLSFTRDLVRECYSTGGRPSIDPVVFFKLQLIMFFEGIRSERQLMDMVNMRLDHRWYIGYDLDEAVPDHSSLSRIRDRFGFEVFQRFFERIIEKCIAVGLVWGEEFYFDSSMVYGNVSFERQIPRFYWQASQNHLKTLFAQAAEPLSSPDLVSRYDGRTAVVKKNSYKKQADYWLNPLDPSATPLGHDRRLGHRLHYVVDGGRARIVLACLVTPSAIQDPSPMLDLAWWTRFRWHMQPHLAVADMRYGTGENLAGLESNGIRAFIPPFTQAAAKRPRDLPKSLFTYDAEQDRYICPQGKVLPYRSTQSGVKTYRAKPRDCRACPLRTPCTRNKHGRSISHSIYKIYEDRVASYQHTKAYKKAMRKRQVWIEPKFGEVKQWHQGRHFRLRGIRKVNIEALFRATGQNIKQLLKVTTHLNEPKPPAHAVILSSFFAIS